MQKPIFLGALALSSLAGIARADVTWEHTATVSMGNSKPVAMLTLRNDWSGDNHRARFSFNAAPGGSTMSGMSGAAARGTVDVIERLGDDKLIFALRNAQNTGVTNYVEEPYSTLQNRLRLNFFEALDPAFAANAEPVPALTDAQRRRLGQELRAYTKPFTQALQRQYFRALPQTRTINGLVSRGFRYTTLSKVPDYMGTGGSQQWTRTASEFWIASSQDGDNEILSFTQRANELKSGAPTVSMWINEILPIIAESMPEESQSFVAALIGRQDDPNYGFKGTLTQFAFTITPPPVAQMMTGGEIRVRADLKRRSNDPIPARAFASPTDGERTEIEPFLKSARDAIQQGRDLIKNQMGSMM